MLPAAPVIVSDQDSKPLKLEKAKRSSTSEVGQLSPKARTNGSGSTSQSFSQAGNPFDRGETSTAGPGLDPPILRDGRLERMIGVFEKTLQRMTVLYEGEARKDNLIVARTFFEKVRYEAWS